MEGASQLNTPLFWWINLPEIIHLCPPAGKVRVKVLRHPWRLPPVDNIPLAWHKRKMLTIAARWKWRLSGASGEKTCNTEKCFALKRCLCWYDSLGMTLWESSNVLGRAAETSSKSWWTLQWYSATIGSWVDHIFPTSERGSHERMRGEWWISLRSLSPSACSF